MKSIKVAIVSPYPPSMGTLNEYAYHMVKQMKTKRDISEIIILTDEIDDAYPEQIEEQGTCKITIKPCWKFNQFGTTFRLIKALRECQADIVLYNIQFLSFGDKKLQAAVGLLAPVVSRIMGIPSVVLLHNITEAVDYESAGITKNPILKAVYSLSGTILTKIILLANLVCLTIPKYVETIEKKYGAKNIALIPHGSFELPPMPDFEKKQDVKTVMTFGKFGTYKKVETMIEAVVKVRERTGEQIKIVIAGSDNPNVKGYLDNVKEKYAHVPDIRFTGYVAEEDVPGLFIDSTLVVFDYTSTTGSSGVLHQAGSYGKAVVIPQIGDLKQLIEEEGYMGSYYEAGNLDQMTDAIERLIVDEEFRTEVAKKNYMASASIPMLDIMDWYMIHFYHLLDKKNKTKQPEPVLQF